MVINTNLGAHKGQRMLSASTHELNSSLARLASGSKIVFPNDDAAGMAVADKFLAKINRNKAVTSSLTSAISFSQTQDGFIDKVTKALNRMGELSVLALDKTKTSNDKSNYQTEFSDLKNYISDIGTRDFNGVSLFDGNGLAVAKDSNGATWTLDSSELNGEDLSFILNSSVTVTNAGVQTMIDGELTSYVKDAIKAVSETHSGIGANLQRLYFTRGQISMLNENLETTVSRIKDLDVAEESAQFARHKILVQSGTAMLAQANIIPQNTLRLLG